MLLGAVSLLPSLPSTATPRSATNGIAVGCSPAFAVAVSQGPSSARRRACPVRTRRMSPALDRHALLALGRLEVRAEDVLARLQPGHAAQARDVEEDAAADQPVLEDLDRLDLAPLEVTASWGRPLYSDPS